MRVIVIGAGLGGLTLAHGLRREGIDVAVYERDAPEGRPQGISLHFDNRGGSALHACLPPEHVAMTEATMGSRTERVQFISPVADGFEVLGSRPLDGKAPRPRPGRQVNRPLLRAVLLSGLEDVVRFGVTFETFEQRPDGTVVARFADGSSDRGDVLVGADGVGSAVRRAYLPRVRVQDTGVRMVMGATPLRTLEETPLPLLLGDNANAVKANGKMLLALNIMRFGQAPASAAEQWLPGLSGPALADAEDYLMWAMPRTDDAVDSVRSPTGLWEVARQRAADLDPTLRLIVEEARRDVIAPLRIGIIPPMRAWNPTPVTVIGDAIHVAPGVGGNLAMQDARSLRDALVRADRGKQTITAAVASYETTMRRNNFPAPLTPRWLMLRYLFRFASPIARRRLG